MLLNFLKSIFKPKKASKSFKNKDEILKCKSCGKEFSFTVGEQEFFKSKGFTNKPSRCKQCRHKRKRMSSGGKSNFRRHNKSARKKRPQSASL